MNGIKELAAKLRNVFSLSEYQKRYDDDGKIQVKTHNGKVLEKSEAFPYGFYAKAAGGKALVFCQGGNFDNFEILPILKSDEVTPPELGEGDVAVYTGGGGRVVLRDGGDVEIKGANVSISASSVKIADGDVDIEGGAVNIKGDVKVSGGSFECGGAVSPTGSGALCALPNCAFTGAPQVGNKAANT